MTDFVVKKGLQIGGGTKLKSGTIAGNATLDLSSGNYFAHAPTADTTFVFSNPPASGKAHGFAVRITPSATVTITYPASVKFPNAVPPTAPAVGETDVLTFYTEDGGTTYYGFQAGDAMQ